MNYILRTSKGEMYAKISGVVGDVMLAGIQKSSIPTKMKGGNRAFKITEDLVFRHPNNPITLYLFKGYYFEIDC